MHDIGHPHDHDHDHDHAHDCGACAGSCESCDKDPKAELLALIAALSMGYYYTALKLTGRLIDTLSLLIIWGLTEATAVRALAVAARRLEHQRS